MTSNRSGVLTCAVLAGSLWSGQAAAEGPRVTGPYAHRNLAVFLVHAKDRPFQANVLTLQEAIAAGKVVLHETGNVNELAVENLSGVDVYIQAGDIVRGGRQDRMISQDLIVSPRSGRLPIGSFCVEQGRWSRRGGESAAAFTSASDQVAGKALKIAARRDGDQSGVWREVAATQEKLAKSVGAAAPALSPSSLQLTLEDGRVDKSATAYVTALSGLLAAHPDAVGVAFAIGGRISSAEVYASRSLFARLWPKLLKAAAVEALSESGRSAAGSVSSAEVQAWLAGAERSPGQDKAVSPRIRLVTHEAEGSVLFETRDREGKEAWVHRSYVAK
jgi:ARG/rhodanese/phosphatase superfamily protein